MEYLPKITHYCTLPHTQSHHRTTQYDYIEYSVTIPFTIQMCVQHSVIVRLCVYYMQHCTL